MTALVIAAGAFEPFYIRIFSFDRARFRESVTELPYRKLPGLRELLVETRARTGDGDTIAIYTPYAWESGYEYAYARSLYPLAGRKVVLFKDVASAQWIAAYGAMPAVPGFTVVWKSHAGAIATRSGAPPPRRREEPGSFAAPAVFLLLASVAGFACTRRIDESLLVGIAICSAILLVVPWSRAAYVAAILAIAVAGVVVRRRRATSALSTQHSALSAIVNLATVILLTGYARFATSGPLWEFDFLSDWGLKARWFFYAGHIDWQFLESVWYRSTHPDYPPLLPLAFDGISVLRGYWSDEWLGVLNVAFAAALLLLVYRLAKEDLGSDLPAAFLAFALMPLAAVPWIGLGESPFVAYATAGLLLMRRNTTAGAVMLGCAALTKNEGITLIIAAAIALIAVRRLRDIPAMWPAVLIPLPWWIMRAAHRLPTDITSGNVFARIAQHATDPEMLRALTSYSLGKPLFWIGLAAGVAIAFRKLDRFVLSALAVQLLFYIGAYLATPHDVAWHVQWSWERLIAHLTPSLAFVTLTALWKIAYAPAVDAAGGLSSAPFPSQRQ